MEQNLKLNWKMESIESFRNTYPIYISKEIEDCWIRLFSAMYFDTWTNKSRPVLPFQGFYIQFRMYN